ncbi:MAG TPA: AAA family ATPase [Gemmatimonadaceae bacterium]|nr:AAA family ATPase [Gemmatimonadaceae bacterium]
MSQLYLDANELDAAARTVVAEAGRRGGGPGPVAVLVAEIDVEPPPKPAADGEPWSPDHLDALNREVFELIGASVRGADLVGRIGERVVVVLNNASADDGRSVGDRICAAVRTHRFSNGFGARTLSIGAAAAPDHGVSYEAVLDAAAAALARIQSQGRDGAAAMPPAHHEALRRPLSIDRFAGRVQELASLRQWLDEVGAGQPRVVAVTGASGTGTATLLRQLESEARLRGGLFASVAAPKRTLPKAYGVWRALLRATHVFQPAPEREWAELQHLEPALGELAVVARPGSQFRLLGELADYVRLLASDRPFVLVLDEMQWADSWSWDALEHLIGQLDRDRIMICLAFRTETSGLGSGPHDSTWMRRASSRPELARQISIANLTRDEVKQWLDAAFHRQAVGRELLAFIYRHTEGNPLFITHLLRSLVEDGYVWHNGMRWEWTPVSELRIPAGRPALIGHRLERFSASTYGVLWTAAIVGREFDVRLLVAAGAGSEPAVRLALSEALSAGLVHPTRERNRGSYAFTHDDVAEVLIDGLPSQQRRQLHLRVAQALERLRPDSTDDIALHYDAAGEQADAYCWGQFAAKTAERVYASGAASSYLQLAARNATSPGELAEIRVALAHLSETRGRFDEVEELCDLAIEWFDGQGDERRSLTLRRLRERARMELGQPALVTLEALKVLEAEAKRLRFDHEHVAVLLMMSQTYGRLGDRRTSERFAAEGVAMAEQVGDTLLLADAVNRLGGAMFSESPSRAYSILERALSLYETVGDARGQARTYGNMGVVAQFESRLDVAFEAYSKAITVGRAGGIPDLWGAAALNLGVLLQRCGDYEKARDLFSEALGLFVAVKHSEYQLAALFNMAHAEREVGRWESATQLYETTVSLAQRIGQADIEAGATAGAGLCALELGKEDEARSAIRALRSRTKDRTDWFVGREVVEALQIRGYAGDDEQRDRAVERLARSVELAESTDMYCAAWLITSCAEAVGRIDRTRVGELLRAYGDRVKKLGYPEMTRRFDVLEASLERPQQ